MISEKDLVEAIEECKGQKNPNANTCIKLAAFYTIKRELYPPETREGYSYSGSADYAANSAFYELIKGKPIEEVLSHVDELVTTLSIVNPRLYDSFMRGLR